MILDRENVFFELETSDLTAGKTSDVIRTGGGNAHNQMYIYIGPGLTAGNMTIDLETAADESFTSPVTLATAKLTTEAVKMRVPVGVLDYLRLKVNTLGTSGDAPTGGKVTAMLVVDVDIK